MSISQRIRRVAIVDDSAIGRESFAEAVSDAEYEPIFIVPPFETPDELERAILSRADAAVLDHRLSQGGLSTRTGAEIAANLYSKRFPALLVTTYSEADILEIRKFRRKIPILWESLGSDQLASGFETCLQEYSSQFDISRAPTNTIIRIVDHDLTRVPQVVFIIATSWNPQLKIALPLNTFDPQVRSLAVPGTRFSAVVNTGTKSMNELYFSSLRPLPPPTGEYAKLLRS